MFFFFFFQAEDGIRDLYVTGVQTCALPIFRRDQDIRSFRRLNDRRLAHHQSVAQAGRELDRADLLGPERGARPTRSEERRVGKECRSRWAAEQYKKKTNGDSKKRTIRCTKS